LTLGLSVMVTYVYDMTTKFYTTHEQALIDILKLHPKSTLSELKMYMGMRKRKEIPYALNGLRIKGILIQTDEQPPRYSFGEEQLA